MINIKIAKAYRTISFEASCMMAGVPLIGLVTEEKASRYKIKQTHNATYHCQSRNGHIPHGGGMEE